MINENLGDELYTKLNSMLDDIATLPVSGLGWLFVWDTIRDVFEDIQTSGGDSTWGEYVVTSGTDLKVVWDSLWASPWGDLDIEGADVVDWLFGEDLIIESDYVKSEEGGE